MKPGQKKMFALARVLQHAIMDIAHDEQIDECVVGLKFWCRRIECKNNPWTEFMPAAVNLNDVLRCSHCQYPFEPFNPASSLAKKGMDGK